MRKIIGTLWDRITRNDINDNFEELYKDVGNITGKITDEVYDEIRNDVKLNWKEPVDTVGDLPSNAETGDTRMVRETVDGVSPVYRYNGSRWVEIQQIDSTAITEVDERLQAEIDKKETPQGAQDKADAAELNAKSAVTALENEIMDDDSEVLKVVESGSNANGRFIRYSDGTQMCWHRGVSMATNTAQGAIYRSTSSTWTFPKEFINNNISVSATAETYAQWADLGGNPSSDGVAIVHYSGRSSNSTYNTNLFAVGRWK